MFGRSFKVGLLIPGALGGGSSPPLLSMHRSQAIGLVARTFPRLQVGKPGMGVHVFMFRGVEAAPGSACGWSSRRVTTHEGRGNVEIFHADRWGAVCDDDGHPRGAGRLPYAGTRERLGGVTVNAHFGKALRPILMDNIYCTGEELHIEECPFDGWGVHDCGRDEAAGVECQLPAPPTTPGPPSPSRSRGSVKLRLVGGRTRNEGRVEVYIPKRGWGTVCGDGWGLLEAATVCRQLGLGYADAAIQGDHFGGGNHTMMLSGVMCTGLEKNLADCLHDQLGVGAVTCPGVGDSVAGVVCVRDTQVS
ncbi:hypothetical protein HPB49_025799 [Dermacentor silvarum]|nr:hypothetical protein HPB49_025799 [Dermacentor silvarum]